MTSGDDSRACHSADVVLGGQWEKEGWGVGPDFALLVELLWRLQTRRAVQKARAFVAWCQADCQFRPVTHPGAGDAWEIQGFGRLVPRTANSSQGTTKV